MIYLLAALAYGAGYCFTWGIYETVEPDSGRFLRAIGCLFWLYYVPVLVAGLMRALGRRLARWIKTP
jgi:hypothetical protein